jgi:hypothetical protein
MEVCTGDSAANDPPTRSFTSRPERLPLVAFARRSSGLARWVALIVLFCVTSPYERAYAMNDRPDSFQPKTGQTVYPQWWSSTAPHGEEG